MTTNAPAWARIALAAAALAALAITIPITRSDGARPVCGTARPGHACGLALVGAGAHGGSGVGGPAVKDTAAGDWTPAGRGPVGQPPVSQPSATVGTDPAAEGIQTPGYTTCAYLAGQERCPGWIIGAYTFGELESNGASTSLINTAFNNSRTYDFGSRANAGVPLIIFQSEQAIADAFADGTLPGTYQAVMYDNEHWPMTPVIEQQHPDLYERLAATIVHNHGMMFIAAPAADIVQATGVRSDYQDAYLRQNLAGSAARYADVIDIQAQYLQPDLNTFVSFAKTAASQAHTANPHVRVYIGIATGPDGQNVTAQQLYASYKAALGFADGYWLNVSSQNQFCPQCDAAKPQLAVTLLHDIYGAY